MAADLKSLQTAMSNLSRYVMTIEMCRSYLVKCAATLKEHETAGEKLEKQFTSLIKELKAAKVDSLDEEDEKLLTVAIKGWGKSQLSIELKNCSDYCNTLLGYLQTAIKEVPKATK